MPAFADPRATQDRLFAELSRMFAAEVPLYDRSLAVNLRCNRAVCLVLRGLYPTLPLGDEHAEAASGERHGAIRIGTAAEYRLVGRFFAAFGMEPHNFYDMTAVGAKSQPVVATAFRSRERPEHRVFTSLLQVSRLPEATRGPVERLLAEREVFPPDAAALLDRAEREGGLSWPDADALIAHAAREVFAWTGRPRGRDVYDRLVAQGLKIAADIACFGSHHLNHLTPNTLWMDLYTAAMRARLGELGEDAFRACAAGALRALVGSADADFLRLHFRHLAHEEAGAFVRAAVDDDAARGLIASAVDRLADELGDPEADASGLAHAGFKDHTEGPPTGVPVLLRQDAYRALEEPVVCVDGAGGGAVGAASHTARFGEIEQRFYATTAAGRALYDRCLAERDRAAGGSAGRDAWERAGAEAFAEFPGTLDGLIAGGLVHAAWRPTAAGRAARDAGTADLAELVRTGLADRVGLRYEDFLPVSAAGIFASNLEQYGTGTAGESLTREGLERVLGRPIVDAEAAYAAASAGSALSTLEALGALGRLSAGERARLESAAG